MQRVRWGENYSGRASPGMGLNALNARLDAVPLGVTGHWKGSTINCEAGCRYSTCTKAGSRYGDVDEDCLDEIGAGYDNTSSTASIIDVLRES